MKRRILAISAIVFLAANSMASAQVTVDVSKITCDEFVKYDIADPRQIAAWISGYYHGLHNNETQKPEAAREVAILAGGCFWGVQGVFQHVKGVTSAVSGYAGGSGPSAQYETVSTGTTGHAESVRVTFDPRTISYAQILQIYFAVAHDGTELNRQGPDIGTQYRSAIFPVDAEQAKIAEAYIGQLNQAHAFDRPIVTKIEPGHAFYPAEGYHQDFLARNPTYPYIAINDLPKIANLKRLFPEFYRPDPVLVSDTKATQ